MKYINFIVGAIAWVPYFIPIVIEGNKRDIKSYFFLRVNPKEYADPYSLDHMDKIQVITDKYNISIKSIKDVVNYPGLTFLMEGDISGISGKDYSSAGINRLNKTHLKVSFTYNADFIWQYHRYIKFVDYVIFPGKSYETAYNKISPKNLYLGSPKFDISVNANEIYKKYSLNPADKHLLFFYPKLKWIMMCPQITNAPRQVRYLVTLLRKIGYKIIIKSREKDRVTQSLGDYYFEETELFPNSSLELLHVCDLAIFFSSATIEECVMSSTPFIDFKVDHKFDRFAFLHDNAYSRILTNLSISYDELYKHIIAITNKNNVNKFRITQQKHMFVNENFSGKLLDYFQPEADERYEYAVKIYSDLKNKKEELEKHKISNVLPILQKINNEMAKEQAKNNIMNDKT